MELKLGYEVTLFAYEDLSFLQFGAREPASLVKPLEDNATDEEKVAYDEKNHC